MCTQKIPSKKMVGVPRYDRRRYLWGKIVSKLEQQLYFRPPRSSPQLVDGARGARNCVPKRVKWREEPLRPLLPRCADLCQFPTFCYLLAFLLSARLSCQNAKKRGRRSCQNAKMRGRAASDQAVKPPWLTLSIAARPPSRHTSHSRSAPRLRRRSFSHGNGIAAPTTACCCRITSLRRFWLLRVPASRPHIVSVFVNAASSLRLDLARSARSRP